MAALPLAGGEEITSIYDADGNSLPIEGIFVKDKDGELEPLEGIELAEEPNNPILPETKEVIWGGIAFLSVLVVLWITLCWLDRRDRRAQLELRDREANHL